MDSFIIKSASKILTIAPLNNCHTPTQIVLKTYLINALATLPHFIDCCLELIICSPTSDNIDYILQTFYRQNNVYQKLPIEIKSSIANKIINLERLQNTRLQEFARQLKFAIKNA